MEPRPRTANPETIMRMTHASIMQFSHIPFLNHGQGNGELCPSIAKATPSAPIQVTYQKTSPIPPVPKWFTKSLSPPREAIGSNIPSVQTTRLQTQNA